MQIILNVNLKRYDRFSLNNVADSKILSSMKIFLKQFLNTPSLDNFLSKNPSKIVLYYSRREKHKLSV